jgi:hypothetical protein
VDRDDLVATMPLSLSDTEPAIVQGAAAPICPRDRDRFLQAVAAELGKYPPERIGLGLVYQIANQCSDGGRPPGRRAHIANNESLRRP